MIVPSLIVEMSEITVIVAWFWKNYSAWEFMLRSLMRLPWTKWFFGLRRGVPQQYPYSTELSDAVWIQRAGKSRRLAEREHSRGNTKSIR